MTIIIFLMSVCGLTLIVVKSKLFMGFRSFVTKKNMALNNKLWFFDSILNCGMCFSLWAGIGLLLIKILDFEVYDFISYPLSAVTLVTIVFAYYEKLQR